MGLLLSMSNSYITKQIKLWPNTMGLNTQQHAYQSFSSNFRICFRLHFYGMLGWFDKNMNYNYACQKVYFFCST